MTSTDTKGSQRDQSRVVCYVDGFNLYHGLRARGWRKYYWLDVWALAERFLKPGQILKKLVYGTARIKDDPGGLVRQLTYLDALQSHQPGVEIVYGHFLTKTSRCSKCGAVLQRSEEKMTDVNLACHLLADAMDDRFEVALVMSGDGDLVPPVRMVRSREPRKRIIAVFPPKRHSSALKAACHGHTVIGEQKLRSSQLPREVRIGGDGTARRPSAWA